MASKEVLVISSSPPKPFTTYNMPSSPLFPSPSKIFTKNAPCLYTDGRASAVSQIATSSLTTASSLSKPGSLQDADKIPSSNLVVDDFNTLDAGNLKGAAKARFRRSATDKVDETPGADVAKKRRRTEAEKHDAIRNGAEIKVPSKARKTKVEKPAEMDPVKEKPPRKSKAKTAETVDDITKDKSTRKPGAKKKDGDGQTKLPKAQITKALKLMDNDQGTKRKDRVLLEDNLFAESTNYGLDEAVKRRTSWTPPRPTVKNASLTTPDRADLLDGEFISDEPGSSDVKSNGFQNLLGSFGFSSAGSSVKAKNVLEGVSIRKRKLIELVKTNVAMAPSSKAKAIKKKSKTITEQATSAYAEVEEESGISVPLLQYFSSETSGKLTSDGFKVKQKQRCKSPIKRGKGTAQEPILLSPESALEQVGNLDFVFGTSSQLAREESPGFLRDMHAAMQASNEVDYDDPFLSSTIRLGSKPKTLSSMKYNLWSAAARDGSGQLLDVEMVDLVDSPSEVGHVHQLVASKNDFLQPRKENEEAWHDVEEESTIAPTITKPVKANLKRVGPVEAAIRFELLSGSSGSVEGVKRTHSPVRPAAQSEAVLPKPLLQARVGEDKKSSQNKVERKPDFTAYTMAQLTKEIASYHFKPIKNRDQMIALLEKCWDAKQQRLSSSNTQTNNLQISSSNKSASLLPPSAQPQPESPSPPQRRPGSDSSATRSLKRGTKTASLANALSRARKARKKADALDEISDSDTIQTPSPPRRHPSQVKTPPLPLQLSSSSSLDDRQLSPASSQARLFKFITTAVKSAPSATNLTSPSWHEKILLYDPIILEDLAVWLNTGALEKAGWDGEVNPVEVKKWCESKSICCLWKENLRGGTRSRY